MGKPSIFSREYDKKMKARKKRKTVLIFCLVVAAVFFLVRTTYLSWQERNAENLKNRDNNKGNISEKEQEDKEQDINNETKPPEKPVTAEKVLDLKLSNGKGIKVIYIEESESKKIKNVISEENLPIYFDINPSLDKVVILDEGQNIYAADLNGNLKDITMPKYITQSSKKEILKAEYLQKKPDFLWHGTPKFINDNTIVWLSQVPWFKTTKYIWKTDVNTAQYSRLRSVEGENIMFENLETQGLKTNIDGNIRYINSEGNIVQ